MPLSGNKKWYLSRGVIGSIIAFLAVVAGFFGISITEGTQVELTDAVFGIIGSIGALLALIGRIKAKENIGGDSGQSG